MNLKPSMTTKFVDMKLFETSRLLQLNVHCMGNRKKAPLSAVMPEETTAKEKKDAVDRSRLRLTKRLLNCPEYDTIRSALGDIKKKCDAHAMPSYFAPGLRFVRTDMVPQFERWLLECNGELRTKLIPKLKRAWPAALEEAKKSLKEGKLFDPSDYPSAESLGKYFGVSWAWVRMAVAEDLPKEIMERETKKLQRKFEVAHEEIRTALLSGFRQLVDHAVDRCTSKPGDKRKHLESEAFLTNWNEFFDTFTARNLTNDEELESLVTKAKSVMASVTVDGLKKGDVRTMVAERIGAIKLEVDALVKSRPNRMIDLEGEE